jgi:hypothetical protein
LVGNGAVGCGSCIHKKSDRLTPGVVIDGKVVHAGGVPGRKKIEGWLL